jgi:hypothetical protein
MIRPLRATVRNRLRNGPKLSNPFSSGMFQFLLLSTVRFFIYRAEYQEKF